MKKTRFSFLSVVKRATFRGRRLQASDLLKLYGDMNKQSCSIKATVNGRKRYSPELSSSPCYSLLPCSITGSWGRLTSSPKVCEEEWKASWRHWRVLYIHALILGLHLVRKRLKISMHSTKYYEHNMEKLRHSTVKEAILLHSSLNLQVRKCEELESLPRQVIS